MIRSIKKWKKLNIHFKNMKKNVQKKEKNTIFANSFFNVLSYLRKRNEWDKNFYCLCDNGLFSILLADVEGIIPKKVQYFYI